MRKFLVAGVFLFFACNPTPSIAPQISKVPSTLPPPTVSPTIEPTPTPKPTIKPKNTEAPKPTQTNTSTSSLSGIASWYCKAGISRCTYTHPSGGYYAAIRKDLLELMGSRVLVCAGKGNCVSVKIIDCNCGKNANLIDLYYDAFNVISNPSLGRVPVTLSW